MRKAQSTIEYTVLITAIVAALVTMQIYVKRGLQGRMRQNADSIGEQYAPGNTTSDMTVSFSSESITTTTTEEADGETVTTTTVDTPLETQSRTGFETVGTIE
jgi:Flp pilus assembly pilin Flp